jgi:hypothetical protein
MSFVHEDPDFDDLLQIRLRLSRGLIEKDYWVPHMLWALHATALSRMRTSSSFPQRGPRRSLLRPQARLRHPMQHALRDRLGASAASRARTTP